jgi:hypothetical protein
MAVAALYSLADYLQSAEKPKTPIALCLFDTMGRLFAMLASVGSMRMERRRGLELLLFKRLLPIVPVSSSLPLAAAIREHRFLSREAAEITCKSLTGRLEAIAPDDWPMMVRHLLTLVPASLWADYLFPGLLSSGPRVPDSQVHLWYLLSQPGLSMAATPLAKFIQARSRAENRLPDVWAFGLIQGLSELPKLVDWLPSQVLEMIGGVFKQECKFLGMSLEGSSALMLLCAFVREMPQEYEAGLKAAIRLVAKLPTELAAAVASELYTRHSLARVELFRQRTIFGLPSLMSVLEVADVAAVLNREWQQSIEAAVALAQRLDGIQRFEATRSVLSKMRPSDGISVRVGQLEVLSHLMAGEPESFLPLLLAASRETQKTLLLSERVCITGGLVELLLMNAVSVMDAKGNLRSDLNWSNVLEESALPVGPLVLRIARDWDNLAATVFEGVFNVLTSLLEYVQVAPGSALNDGDQVDVVIAGVEAAVRGLVKGNDPAKSIGTVMLQDGDFAKRAQIAMLLLHRAQNTSLKDRAMGLSPEASRMLLIACFGDAVQLAGSLGSFVQFLAIVSMEAVCSDEFQAALRALTELCGEETESTMGVLKHVFPALAPLLQNAKWTTTLDALLTKLAVGCGGNEDPSSLKLLARVLEGQHPREVSSGLLERISKLMDSQLARPLSLFYWRAGRVCDAVGSCCTVFGRIVNGQDRNVSAGWSTIKAIGLNERTASAAIAALLAELQEAIEECQGALSGSVLLAKSFRKAIGLLEGVCVALEELTRTSLSIPLALRLQAVLGRFFKLLTRIAATLPTAIAGDAAVLFEKVVGGLMGAVYAFLPVVAGTSVSDASRRQKLKDVEKDTGKGSVSKGLVSRGEALRLGRVSAALVYAMESFEAAYVTRRANGSSADFGRWPQSMPRATSRDFKLRIE